MCEPDFNAYSMKMNRKPKSKNKNARSAGGHIHTEYSNIKEPFSQYEYVGNYMVDEQRAEIVKVMDLFLGVPSTILEPDNDRKELYGKAGAFRPKEYGLEYRTISNFYLVSDELIQWVYDSVEKAFLYIQEFGFLNNDLALHIEDIINTNNKDAAKDIIQEFNLQLL